MWVACWVRAASRAGEQRTDGRAGGRAVGLSDEALGGGSSEVRSVREKKAKKDFGKKRKKERAKARD